MRRQYSVAHQGRTPQQWEALATQIGEILGRRNHWRMRMRPPGGETVSSGRVGDGSLGETCRLTPGSKMTRIEISGRNGSATLKRAPWWHIAQRPTLVVRADATQAKQIAHATMASTTRDDAKQTMKAHERATWTACALGACAVLGITGTAISAIIADSATQWIAAFGASAATIGASLATKDAWHTLERSRHNAGTGLLIREIDEETTTQ